MHIVHSEARQGRTYSTAEVAKKLNIAPETIRKYNSLFYAHNIRFTKIKGKIQYSEKDLQLMKQLQELHSTSGKALADCVAEVVQRTQNDTTVITLQTSQTHADTQQLQQHIERIAEAQKESQEQIQALKTYIDESLNKRDSELMSFVREVQEQKRLLQEIKEQKKKRWWQFWKK